MGQGLVVGGYTIDIKTVGTGKGAMSCGGRVYY